LLELFAPLLEEQGGGIKVDHVVHAASTPSPAGVPSAAAMRSVASRLPGRSLT